MLCSAAAAATLKVIADGGACKEQSWSGSNSIRLQKKAGIENLCY
jgi:hypothetical protein